MNPFAIIWWLSTALAVGAVAAALTFPTQRRRALTTASLLFMVSGLLGLLSIGILFVVAALACAVAAARAGTPGSDPS